MVHTQTNGAATSPARGPVLTVRGLTKRFWGTRALDGVDLEVRPGEVRALLGQNGAGKSTLIKILAGVYQADAGTVELDGTDILSSPATSPIAFIHQDRGLVPGMTVAENIALIRGYPSARAGLVSWRGVTRQARQALELLHLDIDPDADVAELTLAERALVAIARAISTDAKFIVLDEPTAALAASVVDQLIETIRRLREKGHGFLYVTHRIDEVFQLADTTTVMRDGRVVMDTAVARIDHRELIRAIVGKDVVVLDREHDGQDPAAETALDLCEITVGGVGPVSLRTARGEVVGLVGLSGAGQDEVGRVIAGALPASGGAMSLDGHHYAPASTTDALARGVGFVAGDRLEESLASELTVQENLYLNPAVPNGRVFRPRSRRGELASTRAAVTRFDVRPPDPTMPISLLSGGNQQKVAVARWIEAGLNALVLEEPTAGVDIASKAQIHEVLHAAARAEGAVVVVSSDFDEVAQLCDRVYIFNRGHVATELIGDQITVGALTGWATGANDQSPTASEKQGSS
jgi:ribose transport system ATP-binding protein